MNVQSTQVFIVSHSPLVDEKGTAGGQQEVFYNKNIKMYYFFQFLNLFQIIQKCLS